MRTIKFKGWHVGLHEMFSPEQMGKDQLTILPNTGQFINVSSVHTSMSRIFQDYEMIPLQFTGLLDKNGKEIYEGDIVGWFRPDDGCLVEYRSGCFGIDYYGDWQPLGPTTEHFAEVLGNKYEHPELLT